MQTTFLFDVFDIIVPEVARNSGVEVRSRMSAFGPSDDKFAYFGDLRFAEVILAKKAYTNIAAWAGASDRGSWTVLLASKPANKAAGSDQAWVMFLNALTSVLSAQKDWRVICESDCEQYPLQNPTSQSQFRCHLHEVDLPNNQLHPTPDKQPSFVFSTTKMYEGVIWLIYQCLS